MATSSSSSSPLSGKLEATNSEDSGSGELLEGIRGLLISLALTAGGRGGCIGAGENSLRPSAKSSGPFAAIGFCDGAMMLVRERRCSLLMQLRD